MKVKKYLKFLYKGNFLMWNVIFVVFYDSIK